MLAYWQKLDSFIVNVCECSIFMHCVCEFRIHVIMEQISNLQL